VQLVYVVADSSDRHLDKVRSMMGPTPDDVITLITCDGDYRYTGHPILRGEYNKRRVIRATLTSLVAPPGHPLNPARS
jgi:sortase (surface protein transpeptidase)